MEIYGIYFPIMRKLQHDRSRRHRDLRKGGAARSFSRPARALGMPGHAMLGFKIDQQKGTVLTMAALVPSVKFNGTITPREVRSKAGLADARFGGIHLPSYRGFHLPFLGIPRGSALSRKQPNMLLVTRSMLDCGPHGQSTRLISFSR